MYPKSPKHEHCSSRELSCRSRSLYTFSFTDYRQKFGTVIIDKIAKKTHDIPSDHLFSSINIFWKLKKFIIKFDFSTKKNDDENRHYHKCYNDNDLTQIVEKFICFLDTI